LEYIGNFWFTILGWEQTSWLKGFIKPAPFLLLFIPLSALALIHYKQTHHPIRNIISLSILFIITCVALNYMHTPIKIIHTLPFRNKEVTLICHNNHIIFIDPGTLAANASALSWVSYILVPYLIESTGKLFIDHVIILQPSARVFEALALLCTKIEIKKLYLPWWQNKLPKNAWYHFIKLQKIAKETGCKIVRMDKKRVTITIDETDFIHLKPQTNHLHYTTITYPVIHAEGIIDKKLFSLYPNQANKKNKVNNMKTNKVLFVVAHEGYQPIEYGNPKKILEDAGFQVITASDKPGIATATDDSTTVIDTVLGEVNIDDYAGIVFIGGPGCLEHLDNEVSYRIIRKAVEDYKLLGAICVAPRILAKAGALNKKNATGWDKDGLLSDIYEQYNVSYLPEVNVVTDDVTITAKGPRTAKDFGKEIVNLLRQK